MTTKVTLLRDVAKLLKKYKPADLSDAVSSLTRKRQPKRRPKTKTRTASKRAKKAGATKSLQSLKAGSSVRTKRPTATATKSRKRNQFEGEKRRGRVKTEFAASDAIRRNKLRQTKRDATNSLIAGAIKNVNRPLTRTRKPRLDDRGDDYAKWFRIISGDDGEIKKGDLGAESTSREVDQTKEWKETIRHLRIRDLLLSGPLKLNSSSPDTSRIITFLPDGTIGMGQTPLAARWRLSEGKLELLDMAGAVQSRFTLSSDGSFLTQIVDPTERAARTSQLVRIAAKG